MIQKAKNGEKIYQQSCAKCHGKVVKNWSRSDADTLQKKEYLKNFKYLYHEQTPVINVGTDLYRAKGMHYFSDDLNRLAISKTVGAVVETTHIGLELGHDFLLSPDLRDRVADAPSDSQARPHSPRGSPCEADGRLLVDCSRIGGVGAGP